MLASLPACALEFLSVCLFITVFCLKSLEKSIIFEYFFNFHASLDKISHSFFCLILKSSLFWFGLIELGKKGTLFLLFFSF